MYLERTGEMIPRQVGEQDTKRQTQKLFGVHIFLEEEPAREQDNTEFEVTQNVVRNRRSVANNLKRERERERERREGKRFAVEAQEREWILNRCIPNK
jgi:hypothetical protein